MTKKECREDPNSCWNKADDNEPIFVLRAKDAVAPTLIYFWIELRLLAGLNVRGDHKINMAGLEAAQMDSYRRRTYGK